jgi:hypothetical protein
VLNCKMLVIVLHLDQDALKNHETVVWLLFNVAKLLSGILPTQYILIIVC